MISRIIDWCEGNRFLVFTGTLLLALAGVWCLRRVPLDALPDISDVQVIIHTEWAGEPPNVIEDQVTYPIVSSLLAAPRVKGVRAQTMFGGLVAVELRYPHRSGSDATAVQVPESRLQAGSAHTQPRRSRIQRNTRARSDLRVPLVLGLNIGMRAPSSPQSTQGGPQRGLWGVM